MLLQLLQFFSLQRLSPSRFILQLLLLGSLLLKSLLLKFLSLKFSLLKSLLPKFSLMESLLPKFSLLKFSLRKSLLLKSLSPHFSLPKSLLLQLLRSPLSLLQVLPLQLVPGDLAQAVGQPAKHPSLANSGTRLKQSLAVFLLWSLQQEVDVPLLRNVKAMTAAAKQTIALQPKRTCANRANDHALGYGMIF